MSKPLNKMAIANIQPGKLEPGERGPYYDYTHLLPENVRQHYNVKVFDAPEGEHRYVYAMAYHKDNPNYVGVVEATVKNPGAEDARVRLEHAKVQNVHRDQGLGMSLYEAVLAHAKHTHGAKKVYGGMHSTKAHWVHQKLAEKHGLHYDADPAIEDWGGRDEWQRAGPADYDARYMPYVYTLKNDPEDFMGTEPLVKAEKLVIPQRYLPPIERNLAIGYGLDHYEAIALEQMGYSQDLHKHLDGVRHMLGRPGDEPIFFNRAVRLMSREDADVASAALGAFGVPDTEDNRNALSIIVRDEILAKQEDFLFGVAKYQIQPVRGEGVATAEAVQRGINNGYINPVKLNGKHSKGAMVVKDPQTKKLYLLKPGSGKNSPAKGVNETFATQSEREAAYWHVAQYLGIGDTFPRADLVMVNNHQTAAMELLPLSYKNLGERKKTDPNMPALILEPYRANGMVFKWSFIDYILGNPDRHSQNMMVDPQNRRIMLIDHGSAMAGQSFDPVNDENSFIPYYLRAWTGQKFVQMEPKERLHWMPGLEPRTERVFDEWVARVNQHHIAEILKDYNINPLPVMARIAQVRAMPGPKWLVLNKLWSGAI